MLPKLIRSFAAISGKDGDLMKRAIALLLVLAIASVPLPQATGCSTILAGKQATADASVLMSHSCDGDVMGLVYVVPAHSYAPGTRLPMYWNVPRPKTYEEYQANLRKGYDQVGTLPVSETYRSLILAGNLESMTTGGSTNTASTSPSSFCPCARDWLATKVASDQTVITGRRCSSPMPCSGRKPPGKPSG